MFLQHLRLYEEYDGSNVVDSDAMPTSDENPLLS